MASVVVDGVPQIEIDQWRRATRPVPIPPSQDPPPRAHSWHFAEMRPCSDTTRFGVTRGPNRGCHTVVDKGGRLSRSAFRIDSRALFQACLAENIVMSPGTMFSATKHFRHCVRPGVGGAWGQ